MSNLTEGQNAEQQSTNKNEFGHLNLSIVGLGVEYPPFLLEPSALDILTKRHYPESPAQVSPFPFSRQMIHESTHTLLTYTLSLQNEKSLHNQ